MKVRGRSGKQILKRLLYREASRELFERPKAGFGIPVGGWIKADASLGRGASGPKSDALRRLVRCRHRAASLAAAFGRRSDSTPALWSILMFEAWRRESTAQ